MKVAFLPDWREGNPYLNRLADALSLQGIDIVFCDYEKCRMPLQRVISRQENIQVIHLHWIYDLLAPLFWSRIGIKRYFRLLILAADILLCRLKGVRVVWTIHNFNGHESSNIEWERKAQRVMARCVSHIIVHSRGALSALRKEWGIKGLAGDRVSIIRHGNCEGCYQPNESLAKEFRRQWNPDGANIILLFLGAVRRYKGLEQLLSVFCRVPNPQLRLIIAGRPHDSEQADYVKSYENRDSRIITRLDFIPEVEIWAYYKAADLVVLPFQKTLTSGSAILAMTMGRSILLPQHARLLDLAGDDELLYFDTDRDLHEHLTSLKTETLSLLGERCSDIASAWSWSRIGEQTSRVYRGNPEI